MRLLVIVSMLFTVSAAMAGTLLSDQASPKVEGIEICREVALEKLSTIDPSGVPDVSSFRLVGTDYRTWNPAHYAWYEMEINFGSKKKTARTTVQLNRLNGKCI